MVSVEKRCIVKRQIGCGNGLAPFICAGVGLAVAGDNLEERGHGTGVMAEEGNLVALLNLEIHVAEEHLAVDTCRESLDFEYLVARFAVGSEYDARIAARRGLNLLDIELFEHLLTRSGLL